MALSPKEISDAIEVVVIRDITNGEYLRATDQNANIAADDLDLAAKILVIYNNRPTITGGIGEFSSVANESVPVDISFLKLADYDDKDTDTDDLIDELVEHARNMFDQISQLVTLAEYAESYTIEQDSTIKIYDKTMSGVKLSFTILSNRGICPSK